jgi:hypothetical protein
MYPSSLAKHCSGTCSDISFESLANLNFRTFSWTEEHVQLGPAAAEKERGSP